MATIWIGAVQPGGRWIGAVPGSSAPAGSAGSAAGSGSASGIGASLDASAGTATGTGSATGVGSSLDASAGSASGSATASGVGASRATSAGTASGSATATGAAPGSAILRDDFAGTAGADLTGHVPAPVQFGSAVWDDFSALFGLSPWQFKAGGGIVAPAASDYSRVDLAGAAATLDHRFTVRSSDASGGLIAQFRRVDSGGNAWLIEVDFSFDTGFVRLSKTVSGSGTSGPSTSFSFAANTDYAVVVSLATSGGSTSVSVTIGGSAVGSPWAVADASLQSSAFLVFGSITGTVAGTLSLASLVVVDPSAGSAGSADGTSTAAGVGAALDASAGSASGSATAAGVGSALDRSAGTAAGSGSASGVGAALAASAGSASGAGTAAGVGAALDASAGTAAGTSAASGVGSSSSAGSGAGSALGVATASAPGAALAAAAGSAAGSASASGVGSSASAGSAGSAAGSASASGVGAALAAAAGAATGSASAHATSPDLDLPVDLDAAIAARFAADATLPTLATAIRYGCAEDGDRMPYVVFTQASVKVMHNGVGRYERLHYRFNCFAGTAARANAIGDAVVTAYHLQPLSFADGYLMSALWGGGGTIPEHHRGRDNARVWNRTLWFTFTVGRQVP